MNMNNSENEMLPQDQEVSDKNNSRAEQWNRFLESEKVQSIKRHSKHYFSYFLGALARPYRTMQLSQNENVLNAAITAGLIAVLSAVYCLIWFCKLDLRSPLLVGFLKPLLLTAVGLAVACGLIYAVLRIEKIAVDARVLINRFADLLAPAIAVLLCAIVLLLAGSLLFSSLLLSASYLFIFVAINVLLLQYPLNTGSGLIDSFYLIVAANAVTGYIFYKLIASIIVSAMGGFGFF